MNELRERFSNTSALVGHLYHDLTLRDDLQMVFIAVTPYKKEYLENLRRQSRKDHPSDT